MLHIWNKIIWIFFSSFLHEETEKKNRAYSLFKSLSFDVYEDRERYIVRNQEYVIELRKESSDLDVFNQVFINKEYEPLIEYFKINQISPKTIIDCGANIGLTSIQLSQNFPSSDIIAIEPEETNFNQLVTNTSRINNIYVKHNAIWSKNEILKIDRTFRDKKDWSVQTVTHTLNTDYQEIKTITISDIIEEFKIKEIDLLKIDIEGAEAELFKESISYSFLDNTKCIAIEIHDECADRYGIYQILRDNSFTIINSGELTIGIKS